MICGQGNQSQTCQKVKKMTPAIQKQIVIHAQPEGEAAAQSLNLSQIFKKMKPFPEKMDRPPLIVGLDLGRGRWHAVFQSARNSGHHDFTGMGKARALLSAIRSEMGRLGLSETRDVVVCHEIGRDGWWIAEYLEAHGIACVVLSADVLSGNGRAVKTDPMDAKRLAVRLGRFFDGDLECDHVVLRPRPDVLEGRAVSRGRAEAVAMRTKYGNQFKSILALHMEVPPGLDVRKADVDRLRDALGRPLPPAEAEELKRLQRHFKEMDADVAEADRRMKKEVSDARGTREAGGALTRREAMLVELALLKGVGPRIAWVLVHELFHKDFSRARQVGCATGLAAIPRSSGSSDRCAGISRRSNNRLRATLVELAWLWLRYQPDSALSLWFGERTKDGVSTRRMRKVAIVAVARKLAVALWKYLQRGELPDGAVKSDGRKARNARVTSGKGAAKAA